MILLLHLALAVPGAQQSYHCDSSAQKAGLKITCIEYSKENGRMLSRWNWLNGESDGVCEKWYGNGGVQSRYKYAKGLIVDTAVEFYENGTLRGTYICDRIGVKCAFRFVFPSGSIDRIGATLNGKEIDTLAWFYENGKLRRREHYSAGGKINGEKSEWSSSGVLVDSLFYIEGRPIEHYTRDSISARLRCYWKYNRDGSTLVDAECFDSDGVSTGKVVRGNGSFIQVSRTGKFLARLVYENGIQTQKMHVK